jgi:NADH:ubiquinone oxidoreductase subunit K
MVFGDLNLFLFLFLFFSLTIIVNINTALHLLLTAELLWISLYIIVLFIGFIFDSVNLLSLTFFFLIFSAVEFGLGLIIILIQHLLLRSISINFLNKNIFKFNLRFNKRVPIQKS